MSRKAKPTVGGLQEEMKALQKKLDDATAIIEELKSLIAESHVDAQLASAKASLPKRLQEKTPDPEKVDKIAQKKVENLLPLCENKSDRGFWRGRTRGYCLPGEFLGSKSWNEFEQKAHANLINCFLKAIADTRKDPKLDTREDPIPGTGGMTKTVYSFAFLEKVYTKGQFAYLAFIASQAMIAADRLEILASAWCKLRPDSEVIPNCQ